ncbi:MAG: MFS transporter [Planctomycetia bacterium]|nr:MFS transporter [Planctomycetia bacterium]
MLSPTMNLSSPSDPPPLESDDAIYGRSFWLAYAANLMLVCANSLTFRFAEYIAAREGTEELAGAIMQAGLFAAITCRLVLGGAIDHFVPRRLWLLSGIVYIAGGLAFLVPEKLTPLVWLARIAYQTGLAGMFSCSIVHIQNQVPAHRRTEVIGSLGSSGFVGTIAGTQLSDLIFSWVREGEPRFVAMFGGAAALGLAHLFVVLALTRHDSHARPAATPGPFRLLFRYWPGPIIAVAVAQGTGFVVTTVFLTRYATAMSFRGIAMFFLPYALTAFACRWIFRDWGTSYGRHRMVLWGLSGMTVGQLLFLTVTKEWLLIPPAVVCGFGHALLFPAIVSIGAGRFPVQYRGSGTTLVLGFTELGTALAAPLLGKLIDKGNAGGGTQGFSWMFIAASAFACTGLVYYALTAARRPDHDPHHVPSPGEGPQIVEAESDVGDMIAVPATEPFPPKG